MYSSATLSNSPSEFCAEGEAVGLGEDTLALSAVADAGFAEGAADGFDAAPLTVAAGLEVGGAFALGGRERFAPAAAVGVRMGVGVAFGVGRGKGVVTGLLKGLAPSESTLTTKNANCRTLFMRAADGGPHLTPTVCALPKISGYAMIIITLELNVHT